MRLGGATFERCTTAARAEINGQGHMRAEWLYSVMLAR
jgi:hypothetical protein